MCERGLAKAPLATSRLWKPMMRCTVASRGGVSMIFQRARLRKLTSRMSRLSVGSRSLPKGRSPARLSIQVDDAALVIDVVVERHRHPRLVGAGAHLVARVEIEQRLVEDRIGRAGLGRRRERARGGVAIRHVDAEAEVLLDLGEEARKARMRRRRQRGDDVEARAVMRAHLLAAGVEAEIDHVGDGARATPRFRRARRARSRHKLSSASMKNAS